VKKRINWKLAAYIAGGALALWIVIEIILAGIGTPPLPPDQSGITLNGGNVAGHRISTKSWTFDYKSAQLSADGSIGTVEGVHDGVVYKKGKPYLRISAQRISIDTTSLNFTAIGKVTVQMIGDPQRRSFDTDLVQWTNATKLLDMQHPSYLHSGDQTLKFSSVTIDFDKNDVRFGSLGGSMEVRK
jgi:hypothetical protein